MVSTVGLREVLGRFAAYIETSTNLAATTRGRYVYELGLFIASVGDKPLGQLAPGDLERWHAGLVKSGLGEAAVRQKQAALRRFLVYCDVFLEAPNAHKLQNALKVLEPPKDQQPRHPSYSLKPSEAVRIVEASRGPDALDARNTAVLHFLFATGVRRSEVCSIDLEHVDVKGRTATVTGKGGKSRVVFFTSECAKDLAAWVPRREELPISAGEQALFLSAFGRRISDDSVYELVRVAAKLAGIKRPVWTHITRHTLITTLLSEGRSLAAVGKMVGHTRPATTAAYHHPDTQDLQDEYDQGMRKRGPGGRSSRPSLRRGVGGTG